MNSEALWLSTGNSMASGLIQYLQEGGASDSTGYILKILKENRKKNFVKRILDPTLNYGKEAYADSSDEPMTHYMTTMDNFVIPTVVDTGGSKLTHLKNYDDVWEHAMKTGEYIEMPDSASADWFSKNYKRYWDKFPNNPYTVPRQ